MLVTTTERISGQEYEIIGEVFGLTTRSKNMFKDLGAGLKSVVGGEIKGYTDMQREARDQAIERLKAEASKLGADAVVMMRFDSGTIGTDMQSVVAYGTAVKYIFLQKRRRPFLVRSTSFSFHISLLLNTILLDEQLDPLNFDL